MSGSFEIEKTSPDVLRVALSGNWRREDESRRRRGEHDSMAAALLSEAEPQLRDGETSRIEFDTTALSGWDSGFVMLARLLDRLASETDTSVEHDGLPAGVQRLVRLASAVPPRGGRRSASKPLGQLALLGTMTLSGLSSLGDLYRFLLESLGSLGRFALRRARYQRRDVLLLIQDCGPQALPIVGVINLLLGVILAFMGAVQLQQFGAEVFVADLVALGQTREIAPMMTGIVIAGRTGAAYAAQLGTMQVNEETDALQTFGFSPIDFLVLPRMLALALMMPLLVVYADVIGIFGGYLVGAGMLGIGTSEYITGTRAAIDLVDVSLGVLKGSVFGILVAVTGCQKGMQSGRSASAVGDAATSAVVSGILAIIVATSIFAVLTNAVGI